MIIGRKWLYAAMALTGGFLGGIAAMDFSNVAEDEFNDWYDLEHIPERERVPGFLKAQRWIGVESPRAMSFVT